MTLGPIACACVACLFLAGCKEDQEAEAPPAVRPARVAVVTPHTLELAAQGAGRVEARYVSQVGFEVGGRLISRDVDVGSVVKKGERLAALSATDFENKVITAEADLATAKATLTREAGQEERDRILADKGYTPQSVHDESLKALRSAEAAVQAAEKRDCSSTPASRSRTERERASVRRSPRPISSACLATSHALPHCT